ncbi:S-layer homology domain-containing protein [Sporosarcina sp. Sa2YVA2]|uniref:S-layer homology domain-containing protein n=1 Tax=Sporosarcina quadrami TaxID=2762234 RepID=A0ABR8U972_9BACL|nr:S-layer homology domain-containing protein [Sporosarcina quadrami]MBD7984594.1 S-layer homology domain-containing protein [Sporosarcina quadrami]
MANQPTKYRKFIVGAASAALVASAVAPVASAKDFKDTKGNTHEAAIDALSDKNIITGYEDGTFKPNKTLTRQDVVKLMGKWLVSEGYTVPADARTKMRFADLKTTSNGELLDMAALAYDNGLFIGTPDGKLDPAGNITRENMAVVLVRAFDRFHDIDLASYVADQDFKKDVTDLGKAKAEARPAIDVLDFFDITNPAAPVFNPKDTTTRGHFATFLHKALNTDFSDVTSSAVASGDVKVINANTVEVTFKEPVLNIKSLDFTIDGLTVANAAVKQTNPNVVVLTTADQKGGEKYTVKLDGKAIGTFVGISKVLPKSIAFGQQSLQGKTGQQVILTADIGIKEAGVPVTFNVSAGSDTTLNPQLLLEATTDENGIATYSYTRYAGTTDVVTAYPTGNPSVRATALVYWNSSLAISEVTEGNVLTNGSKKVYKVTGAANTHVNVTFAENVDVTPDKGVRGVTVTDATVNSGTTPYQYLNGNVNQVRVLLNSKGEATFTVTGSNASVTPIVFLDSGAAYNSSNQWVGGNGKLDPTELQAKAATVKFDNVQSIELSIVSKGNAYASARQTVTNGGRDYEVTVKDKDGKLAPAGTPVYLTVLEADQDGDVYHGALTTPFAKNGSTIRTIYTDAKGVAKFTLQGSNNAWAVPTVFLENGSKAGLDEFDAQVRGEIVYFGAITERTGSVYVTDKPITDPTAQPVETLNANGDIAYFNYSVADQNGKALKGLTEAHNLTFEITNTGFNDAVYKDANGIWTTVKAGKKASISLQTVNGQATVQVKSLGITDVTVNVSGSQYTTGNKTASVSFVSPAITSGLSVVTDIDTQYKYFELTRNGVTQAFSYDAPALLYINGQVASFDKFEQALAIGTKINYTKVGENNSFNIVTNVGTFNSQATLATLLADTSITAVELSATTADNLVFNRLVNVDLNGKSTGNINVTSNEIGVMSITNGTIGGNLTVDTKNADFTNGATVSGTTTITDVKAGTFVNTGKLSNVVITDSNGTAFTNKGLKTDVGVVEVNSTGDVVLSGKLGTVEVKNNATIILAADAEVDKLDVKSGNVILEGEEQVKEIAIANGATLKDYDGAAIEEKVPALGMFFSKVKVDVTGEELTLTASENITLTTADFVSIKVIQGTGTTTIPNSDVQITSTDTAKIALTGRNLEYPGTVIEVTVKRNDTTNETYKVTLENGVWVINKK